MFTDEWSPAWSVAVPLILPTTVKVWYGLHQQQAWRRVEQMRAGAIGVLLTSAACSTSGLPLSVNRIAKGMRKPLALGTYGARMLLRQTCFNSLFKG